MTMKGILYKRGVNGCGVRIFGFHTPMHKRFETACAVHDCGVLVIADRQVANPTHEQLIATWWEVYHESMPTEEERLRIAIEQKVVEIEAYSNSDAVNDLTYNGMPTWLTPDVRANYKVSIDAAELLGENNITFAIGE